MMGAWLRRLRHLVRGSDAENDLREEIEAHRLLHQARLERDGLSPHEAARASRRALGNVTLAQEEARDVWAVRWLGTLRQDVRNGTRVLLKHPGVTAAAIVSLALGIGANTAAFSLVDGILLKPLPYHEPDRLVVVLMTRDGHPDGRGGATAPEYLAWQRQTTPFDGMATAFLERQALGGNDTAPAETVVVEKVRASLFDVLGVRPLIGRVLRADEEALDAPAPVVVLSEQFWARRYGRDPNVLDQTLTLSGVPHRIVGVMPSGFTFLTQGSTDLFIPLSFDSPQLRGSTRIFPVAARLEPGVTVAQAQAQMDAVVTRTAPTLPAQSRGWHARVLPFHEVLRGNFRPVLSVLQAIVGLILLIACGNVAGLLLARSSSRRTELAVRAAIGAGRMRLLRQLLTESTMLALAGGVVGVAVGWLCLRLLVTTSAAFLPDLPKTTIDVRVLAFTCLVAVCTGLLFGILPALQGTRTNLVESLKSWSGDRVHVLAGQRLRAGVVVVQLALAFVLLMGAGLTLRTLVKLETADLGGQPEGVLRIGYQFVGMFRLSGGSVHGYPLVDVSPRVSQTTSRILERLRGIPGVESAAGASQPPFTAAGLPIGLRILGGSPDEPPEAPTASFQVVTPGFFSTLRIPMTRGREFGDDDAAAGPWGIVINQAMASRCWPGADPIGQHVLLDLTEDERPREVIGVVSDFRSNPYEEQSQPAMFVLYSQQPLHTRRPLGQMMRARMNFVVRGAGDPAALAGGVRAAMRDFYGDRSAPDVRVVEQDVANVLEPSKDVAVIFGVFAGIATLLAAVGFYGVMSHSVGLRTREIGIRMALGADAGEIFGLIMRRVALLAALGLAGGLAGGLALRGVISKLSSVVVGVPATDPPTYIGVSLLMAGIAFLAGWIPTRRAIRVAPTVAMRCE